MKKKFTDLIARHIRYVETCSSALYRILPPGEDDYLLNRLSDTREMVRVLGVRLAERLTGQFELAEECPHYPMAYIIVDVAGRIEYVMVDTDFEARTIFKPRRGDSFVSNLPPEWRPAWLSICDSFSRTTSGYQTRYEVQGDTAHHFFARPIARGRFEVVIREIGGPGCLKKPAA